MTNFIPRNLEATKILSEELEKKIEEVNAHMVDARSKAEQSQLKRNTLDKEVQDLEIQKKNLEEAVYSLQGEVSVFVEQKDSLKVEITDLKSELKSILDQITEAKMENEEENQKAIVLRESMKKEREDLDAQSATLRIYGQGLEDRKNQIDVYEARVKKFLEVLKP